MNKRQKRIKELRKIAYKWEKWHAWTWDRAFYVISHVLTVDTIGTTLQSIINEQYAIDELYREYDTSLNQDEEEVFAYTWYLVKQKNYGCNEPLTTTSGEIFTIKEALDGIFSLFPSAYYNILNDLCSGNANCWESVESVSNTWFDFGGPHPRFDVIYNCADENTPPPSNVFPPSQGTDPRREVNLSSCTGWENYLAQTVGDGLGVKRLFAEYAQCNGASCNYDSFVQWYSSQRDILGRQFHPEEAKSLLQQGIDQTCRGEYAPSRTERVEYKPEDREAAPCGDWNRSEIERYLNDLLNSDYPLVMGGPSDLEGTYTQTYNKRRVKRLTRRYIRRIASRDVSAAANLVYSRLTNPSLMPSTMRYEKTCNEAQDRGRVFLALQDEAKGSYDKSTRSLDRGSRRRSRTRWPRYTREFPAYEEDSDF